MEKWTLEETQFLRNNVHKGYEFCAQQLGRSEYSVNHKARLLDLSQTGAKGKRGSNNKAWNGHGQISAKYFTTVRSNAKKRKIPFEITIRYVWDLYLWQNKKCALSGVDIDFAIMPTDRKIKQTASLDRIDSSRGYVEGNVQWVHKIVNVMKWKLSQEEFIAWCQIIAERH